MTGPVDPGDVDVRRRLRGLRVEPQDAGFARVLHQRLAEAGPPAPARRGRLGAFLGHLRWPAAGLAAAILAYALLGALRGPALPRPDAVATRVPATQVALVHLNLSAAAAVASADIEVSLPEGLVFWVDGAAVADRSFEWRQPLAAGDNEIPVAIRGERPGRYRLTVTARAGAERVEHEVVLEVTGT